MGGRWRNLWDLSDTATMDVGLSGVQGRSSESETVALGAVDLSVRWRPLGRAAKERSVLWRNELLVRRMSGETVAGAYSLARWQWARRWFVLGRYERFGFGADAHAGEDPAEQGDPHAADPEERWRASVAWAYVPSEFQALRLQASHTQSTSGDGDSEDRIMLQYIFSLGSHPAHLYW